MHAHSHILYDILCHPQINNGCATPAVSSLERALARASLAMYSEEYWVHRLASYTLTVSFTPTSAGYCRMVSSLWLLRHANQTPPKISDTSSYKRLVCVCLFVCLFVEPSQILYTNFHKTCNKTLTRLYMVLKCVNTCLINGMIGGLLIWVVYGGRTKMAVQWIRMKWLSSNMQRDWWRLEIDLLEFCFCLTIKPVWST